MLKDRHPRDHVLLLALDLQLPGRRQARVAAHVHTCGACQTRAAHLRSTVADACRAYRVTGEPASTGDARGRFERALQQAGETWDRSWWTRWRHRLAVTPATIGQAAAAAVAVIAVAWMAGSSGVPRGRAPQQASRSALPVAALTPGAVSTLTAEELCAGTRASRTVSNDVRRRVLAGYGMEQAPADGYELDALITPELGGIAAPENLWPQPYRAPVWNAHVKDALERFLADEVCRGRMPLVQAQQEIATDWIAAYKRHFRTNTPQPAHARSTSGDDDLVFDPPAQVQSIAELGRVRHDVRQ